MADKEEEVIKLLPKDEIFLASYLREGNATRAYMEAHPNVTEASAGVLASRLMKRLRPEIAQVAERRGLTLVYILAVLQTAIEDPDSKWSERLRALEDLTALMGLDKKNTAEPAEAGAAKVTFKSWKPPESLTR